MNSRFVAGAAGLLLASAALPASAQYANEFTPAKLIKQGTTSKSIAGSGLVVVQVQVNPDGTHKVLKVIKSTNAGDNDAAMDVAASSSYKPATRGTTPIVSFYDFTLKFSGKSVVSSEQSAGSGQTLDSTDAPIANLIRAGQYAAAQQKAQAILAASPTDDTARQLLGIAQYDAGDVTGAAATFDRVATIGAQFKPVATQSFAASAVQTSQTDPAKSMAYAQKAIALDAGSTDAKFALGVAQVANKQYADGLATLKAVHQTAFADPKTPVKAKVGIDSSLLLAYTQTNDAADAQAIGAELKQLDPTSTLPARTIGNALLESGVTASKAGDNATALKDFDQAAAAGDPDVALVANTQAAFLIAKGQKPDYALMKSYADKALAIKAEDAPANFAEGFALAGEWATGGRKDDALKKQAQDTLSKADSLAKAAGNESLALQIESFMKQTLSPPAPAASSSP
jgi:tetratricopeptide (TPR) repeat protein